MGTESYTYDNYNRLTDEQLGTIDLARPSYDSFGRLQSVSYPTSSPLAETVAYDSTTGVKNSLSYTLAGSVTASDATALTQSTKIHSDTVTSGASSLSSTFGYDTAGRLTSATIGSHAYSYGFGTQNSACGTGSNMNANSGKDGNRTSQTIDGVTNTYCYNYADQLVSSSDPTLNAPVYDSHGNITQLGTNTSPLRLGYDSSDRNMSLVQKDGSGNGNGLYYYKKTDL